MNKVFRILGGTLLMFCALLMSYATFLTMSTGDINPRFLDSIIDQLMFVAMSGGCALIMAVIAIKLFGLLSQKRAEAAFMFSAMLFASGLYYHHMFGSPF